jgi:hypothetical protein
VGAADLTGREIMTAFDTGSRFLFSTGTEVEVLTRYEGHWASGFAIASVDQDRFRLRRHSDGVVLPVSFSANQLRLRR